MQLLPLSQGQLGIWLAQRLDPAHPRFNIAECIAIDGAIDSLKFERALRYVVAATDALHLRFIDGEAGPSQYFRHEPDWTLIHRDFSDVAKPEKAARDWMQRDMDRPFRLDGGLLYRTALLRVAPDRYFWYAVNHHIICDGVGSRLVIERVAAAYNALADDRPLPSLPKTSWRDVIAEEITYRSSEQYQRDRNFWLKHVGDLPTRVTLAGGSPRRSDGVAKTTGHIPLDLDLEQLARRYAASPAALFVAAVAIYLHGMTGAEDLLIGVPVTGRIGARSRSVVGMAANVIPLRVSISSNKGLGEVIGRIACSMRSAMRHQRYRSEDLRRDLGCKPGDPDICGTHVNFMPLQRGIGFGGNAVSNDPLGNWRVENLQFVYFGGTGAAGQRIDLVANAEHYTEADLALHCGRFIRVIEQIAAAEADAPVQSIDLVSKAERSTILRDWNATACPVPRGCVHDLFEDQVLQHPDSIALAVGDCRRTYAELNEEANRLAHALVARGIGPGDRVALAIPRSIEMAAALLAVLKSGAAYVPIDPDYPPARIAYILDDSSPSLVLTTSQVEHLLPARFRRLITDAAATSEELRRCPAENLTGDIRRPPIGAAHPAYVIYTSGSTGQPKGVVGLHSGMVNRLSWMGATLPFADTGPTLAKTSLSFIDGSTELLGPLASGASVVLADREAAGNPAHLAELIERHRIGRITLIPSLLSAILDTVEPSRLAACKLWIVSGETLPTQLSRRFSQLLPDARLVNLYGVSEASGDSLCAVCTPGDAQIGRPIWNTRAYVLNRSLDLMPPGGTGELYLAGIGLAAGYLGRDDLTRESFIPDPHGGPGDLMYRTGDFARWRSDGSLEFVGRIDDQVNLNGIRIEVAEIESALRADARVGDAAVIVRETDEARQLVAFVTAASSRGPLGAAELRAHLATLLPAATIPSAFIPAKALPRLPNGKLDRRALRTLAAAIDNRSNPFDATLRTPTEVALAEIWSDVLHRPIIGRSDDFFALGGDSLRAIQVMTRVRKLFGLELPLDAAFGAKTLETLAKRIDMATRHETASRPAPVIANVATDGKSALSFSQQRMWIIQSLDPQNTAYNISGAFLLYGALDIAALSHAIEEIERRHDILRTTYRIIGGDVVQKVQIPRRHVLEVIDLRASATGKSDALKLANRTASTPIDLANGPVFACRLFCIGPREHVLQITLHHIAADQWSVGIIGRELSTIYNARIAGKKVGLAAPVISYSDFAIWQRSRLDSDDLDAELSYWRRTLSGVPPLNLPTDKARPRVPTFNGSNVQSDIAPCLFSRLEKLGRREGVTLFMTMFAGFVALLHRLTGQTDICVGVPVANRTDDGVEQIVGTFVNLLALRVDLSGDPTFSELLRRVRTAALDAFANQDVPFDRLVQELAQTRDSGRAPLTQVMFNMLNAPMHGIEIEGIQWEPLPIDRGGAQFELSMSIDRQISRSMTVEYNTDLFNANTIERFMERYSHVLSEAAAAPDTRLSKLDPMPDEERHLVLHAWNATAVDLPQRPFIAMFEQRVAERPDVPAVTFNDVTLSYSELNARANSLASELSRSGVTGGVGVGVCVERSLAMLVALLAVQKAGGAYVPLDPALPAHRLDYMIRDSGLGVVIVGGVKGASVELPAAVARIEVDRFDTADAPTKATNPATSPGLSDPAYIIYTSGSTGRPKGVTVSHASLANFLCSMRRTPGLGERDVIAAITTISFDIAGLELYLPLLAGARIELVPSATAADGKQLSKLLETKSITVMQATPATWRMLIDSGWRGRPGLRALCGGEALPRELADQLIEHVGELWNLYGPTETTIWSTAGLVEPGDAAISIGRPIDNTQIYILNGRSPAPIGVAGEICIGGAGVAIGYHDRPELTADLFVAATLGERTPARIYRTGDLGLWGADGKLYHLGRMDHQVKIRGFRVETGEIESVLLEHPSVRQAIVVAREMGPGDVRLIAYAVYAEGEALTISEMRSFLRTKLPDYMIPAMAVALQSIPLTANGKLDRSALPEPFAHAVRSGNTFQAPRPGTEVAIADLWAEVLDVEKVGAEDNFFELGGDSLLALRLVSRIERRTGKRIDPRTLFFQDLRQIAACVSEPPRD